MLKRYGQQLLIFLVLSDLLTAVAAWTVAYALLAAKRADGLQPVILVAAVLVPLVFNRAGLYFPKRTFRLRSELVQVVQAILLAWILTYVIVGLVREKPIPRQVMFAGLIAWMALGTLSRAIVRVILRHLRSRGFNHRRVAILGTGRLAQKLHTTLVGNPWTGISIEYFLDDGAPRLLRGVEVLGPLSEAANVLARRPVDIAFVAVSGARQSRVEELLHHLSTTPVDLRIVPNTLALRFLGHEVSQLGDLAIISLTDNPQQGWNRICKSLFDRAAALLAIGFLAIPMMAIALLIKLTSQGPIFYRQVRASLGGKPFSMLKFRTMRTDAESDSGPVWTVPNDPRVTRFGRWLRQTSLDELPQLINVLRGDMSLVGPRPERPEFIGQFKDRIPRYMLRHHVKAGMTGWAQIHGMRGQTSLRKRLRYDLFYIRNWSFGLDLWILLLTPFRLLAHTSAY
ncbi:MAG: undecaprenyl-phosphate glucose phosphotransferase [Tepidisphaeraceae bacterium]